MKIRVGLLAGLMLSAPVAASAQNVVSGVELNEMCSDHSSGSIKSLSCLNYLQGFGAGLGAGEGSKEKDAKLWSLPAGVTVAQARLVVEKYMRDHPQILHEPAGLVVGVALLDAFPCKPTK